MGAAISLGKGVITLLSHKWKLNTKRSTEAELLGLDETLSRILWTNYFIIAQGYPIDECQVYQDKQSDMLLEINGKDSSGSRTHHMNIKYFFLMDRIQNGELVIKYCPTKEMTSYYFTKPLQGHSFQKFWVAIINVYENIPDAAMADELAFAKEAHLPQDFVGACEKNMLKLVGWEQLTEAVA